MKEIKNAVKKIAEKIVSLFGFTIKRVVIKNDDLPLYIKLYGEESVKHRRFYNISAGSYLGFGGGMNHPCWTKIDVDRQWNKAQLCEKGVVYNPERDIFCDMLAMEPFPVETSAAELVHTRFTIASITDAAAQYLFGEVHRILKNGGIFRISTPNIDLDYRAYFNNDMTFFYWFENDKTVSIEQAFLFHVASQLSSIHPDGVAERITDEQFRDLLKTKKMEDALDFCTSKCSVEIQKKHRQDHINWWNAKKLERMLRLAGFKSIYLSSREQSASPVMRNEAYFDNEDNKFVMYMEAVKI